jgi:hypothetical protein
MDISGVYEAGKPFRGDMISRRDEARDLHLHPATKFRKVRRLPYKHSYHFNTISRKL